MRNALRILVVAGVLSVLGFEQSKASDVVPNSVYAAPVQTHAAIPGEDEPGLMPMRASDHQPIPVIELNDRATVPQATVEAIPTPTAFHAGGALLVGIALTRVYRKLRRA
jgi:hypothetical protein